MMSERPVLVGISGGTASGKTSMARILQMEVGREQSLLLELDSYYRDLTDLDLEARRKVNFDHPDAFDWDLLVSDLEALLRNESVRIPVYDYASHNRREVTELTPARPVLILEGILVFWHAALRDLMDIKVFVDTPADLRLLRRIRRDTVERQRSLESVLDQYEHSVAPMHLEFCEPSKVHADLIIPRGAKNRVAMDMVRSRLLAILAERLAP
jgi:uridine kinase